MYNNGTYSSLPNFEGNYIHASGINNHGLIVGHFYQATGSPLQGFIYDGSTYTVINDPNATNGTVVNGINDLGQLVGSYSNSTGTHGFLATPVSAVPIPTTILLFGSALIGLMGFNRNKLVNRII